MFQEVPANNHADSLSLFLTHTNTIVVVVVVFRSRLCTIAAMDSIIRPL